MFHSWLSLAGTSQLQHITGSEQGLFLSCVFLRKLWPRWGWRWAGDSGSQAFVRGSCQTPGLMLFLPSMRFSKVAKWQDVIMQTALCGPGKCKMGLCKFSSAIYHLYLYLVQSILTIIPGLFFLIRFKRLDRDPSSSKPSLASPPFENSPLPRLISSGWVTGATSGKLVFGAVRMALRAQHLKAYRHWVESLFGFSPCRGLATFAYHLGLLFRSEIAVYLVSFLKVQNCVCSPQHLPWGLR